MMLRVVMSTVPGLEQAALALNGRLFHNQEYGKLTPGLGVID
jgi:hypothetical protein